MRNLKHYEPDSFEFYRYVVGRKHLPKDDPDYKTRLAVLQDDIQQRYGTYDGRFDADELALLQDAGYTGQVHDDLLSLYSYRSKPMQQLKNRLTTNQNNRKINICQNCTISEVGTFDHLVPKEEFAEFAVHPRNLLPSCHKCNNYKGAAWRNNGQRTSLNIFLDVLPLRQYLFVNLSIVNGEIEVGFYLDNMNGIDAGLFGLIDSHYRIMHLCRRFWENCDDVIDELVNDLEASIEEGSNTLQEAINVSIAKANKDRRVLGFNYWKSILELAILDDAVFLNHILNMA